MAILWSIFALLCLPVFMPTLDLDVCWFEHSRISDMTHHEPLTPDVMYGYTNIMFCMEDTHTHTHARMRAHVRMHTHARTQSRTHTHTHTGHTHSHTATQTHRHTAHHTHLNVRPIQLNARPIYVTAYIVYVTRCSDIEGTGVTDIVHEPLWRGSHYIYICIYFLLKWFKWSERCRMQ